MTLPATLKTYNLPIYSPKDNPFNIANPGTGVVSHRPANRATGLPHKGPAQFNWSTDRRPTQARVYTAHASRHPHTNLLPRRPQKFVMFVCSAARAPSDAAVSNVLPAAELLVAAPVARGKDGCETGCSTVQ